MTTDQAPQQPRLRVRLLGTFAVERDGVALPAAEVGSRKARTVLKILAGHRGRTVSMHSLVASLWGDASPADAAANVATLVSRLRAALGAGVIDGSRAGYRLLTGSSVVVDLDEAAGLVAEADARLGQGNRRWPRWPPTRPAPCSARGRCSRTSPMLTWQARPAARPSACPGGHARRAGAPQRRWAITAAPWPWRQMPPWPTLSTRRRIGRSCWRITDWVSRARPWPPTSGCARCSSRSWGPTRDRRQSACIGRCSEASPSRRRRPRSSREPRRARRDWLVVPTSWNRWSDGGRRRPAARPPACWCAVRPASARRRWLASWSDRRKPAVPRRSRLAAMRPSVRCSCSRCSISSEPQPRPFNPTGCGRPPATGRGRWVRSFRR